MTYYSPKWWKEFKALGRKQQATSSHNLRLQAASDKHQAPSEDKKSPQASSDKQQAS
jgi:hypothetical protein